MLIQSHIDKKDFTSDDVRKTCFDPHRSEQLSNFYTKSSGLKPSASKKKKAGEPKTPKVDTKKLSFDLYKEGHGIEEIAKRREMAPSTIEGHMAFFITKGEADAVDFIPQDKIDNIITVSKKLDSFQFGEIKGALGEEYSYGDIKLAIASHLAEK